MMSEKIELLGKGLYTDIPNELTLQAIPTVSELEYVGAEDFEETMLESILPKAVEEKINFRHLLEIDFQWVCRCLRLLNYGPYFTTNALFCSKCGQVRGEAQVDLRTVECKPLPEGFSNSIVIDKSEFIDFNGDVTLHLPTIQDILNAYKDKMFKRPTGEVNKEYARICYMISAMGKEKNLNAPSVKAKIEKELSSSDFIVLKEKVAELTDYGLRAGGKCQCPRCKSEAVYVALVDDRFFRPTLGDIKSGKTLRSARGMEDAARSTPEAV